MIKYNKYIHGFYCFFVKTYNFHLIHYDLTMYEHVNSLGILILIHPTPAFHYLMRLGIPGIGCMIIKISREF